MVKASNELESEAKEVLEQIVANIEIKDPDNTMSKSETPKMTKEKALIQKLQDEKKELQDQIKELEEMKDVNTEKAIHLRNLRAKKREVSKELQIALEKIEEEKYEELHKKKTEEKKTKSNEEREKIFGKTLDDKLKPTEENENTFIRNFNMFGKYRDAIKSLKDEIKQLMSRDSSEMISQQIDERDLVV